MSSASLFDATVLAVHHWTDRLFSFSTTRESSFRFVSGQFAMIGLIVDGRPLLRAYSMASSEYEPTLEFLDTRAVLEKFGLGEGNMSRPGHFVVERAFVDK